MRVLALDKPHLQLQHLLKSEAKSCCRELVEGIKAALNEVHDMSVSHNDVRLFV